MYAAIYDIDGTLADISDIRHYAIGGLLDYDAFHREARNSHCHPRVVEACRWDLECGFAVFIVTARNEKYKDATVEWLRRHEVKHHGLFMRKSDDMRDDVDVKRDILAEIRGHGYQVVHAWDDNPHVAELWRSEGIIAHLVPGWVD